MHSRCVKVLTFDDAGESVCKRGRLF